MVSHLTTVQLSFKILRLKWAPLCKIGTTKCANIVSPQSVNNKKWSPPYGLAFDYCTTIIVQLSFYIISKKKQYKKCVNSVPAKCKQ